MISIKTNKRKKKTPLPPKKQKRKKDKKTWKTKKNTKNEHFSYQTKFLFSWGVQKSPFSQIGQNSARPQNTIKIGGGGFQQRIFEKSRCIPKRPLWTKTPKLKSRNSSYQYFFPFSSLSTTKNTRNCWNPYFYSALANTKKRTFKNWAHNKEIWKIKNCTPSLKKNESYF